MLAAGARGGGSLLRRFSRERLRHVRELGAGGPVEAGYAFFRARRRARNRPDTEPELPESEALALASGWDVTPEELARSARRVEEWERGGPREIRSVQWFIPWFHNVHGGGVRTILRFADRFAREHGVENRFCVYDRADPGDLGARLAGEFPSLAGARVTGAGEEPEESDAAIATSWPSAFPLVRHDRTGAKFFLVQDWEPAFHPAGSASAVLDQAARFGIPGIVNTPGLADAYRAAGSPALSFRPAVDRGRFHPAADARPERPARIVFYARPSVPRNAFALGLRALRRLKADHGDGVEIVAVGESWHPGAFGVGDVLENRGDVRDMDALAELYRSSHVGLFFMLTRHPSYLPLEWMASGLAVVTNRNPHTAWLLRDEENALLAPPLPSAVAAQLGRLVRDAALRERLAAAGAQEVSGTSWEEEIDRVWAAMCRRGDAFTLEPEC